MHRVTRTHISDDASYSFTFSNDFVKYVLLLQPIGIIKSITVMTLYMNSMWWPPQSTLGAFLNQAIFLMLSALTVVNFVMASIVGPGTLPLQWRPKVSSKLIQSVYNLLMFLLRYLKSTLYVYTFKCTIL